VEVVVLSDDEEEEDAIQEDEQAPTMGWTTKFYYKPRCESSISHHRLKGILQTYYADWEAAMEYVCDEHTHPLEDTYWKTRVCIYIRDEEKEAYLLDSNYVHHAHRATMEDSIEDAVAEAYMGLYGRRFDDMKEDQYQFLPRQHPKLEWAIMDPESMDPTT